MKNKYGSIEIKLKGVSIGNAFVFYDQDTISEDVILYPAVSNIPGIQFARQWKTFDREKTDLSREDQAEEMTRNILSGILLNVDPEEIELDRKREVFDITIKVDHRGTPIEYNCLLMYEYACSRSVKTIQVLKDNCVYHFPMSKPDSEIQNEVLNILLEKYHSGKGNTGSTGLKGPGNAIWNGSARI